MTNRSLIENAIEALVSGDATPQEVASSVLDSDLPERVALDESEEDVPPSCIRCGNPDLDVGVLESEDGELDYLHCTECDLGYVREPEEDSEGGDLEEAEIDENDPACPNCGSGNLDAGFVEHEGEEVPVLHCQDCDCGLVVSE